MRFREEIKLHGVIVAVTGEWEAEEAQTWDYPGSEATASVTTATVGGIDVSDWINSAGWTEDLDSLILAAVGVPEYA